MLDGLWRLVTEWAAWLVLESMPSKVISRPTSALVGQPVENFTRGGAQFIRMSFHEKQVMDPWKVAR